MDPDGRDIELDGTESEQYIILDLINSLSEQQYKIQDSFLVLDDDNKNLFGSSEYSSAINVLIQTGHTKIRIGEYYEDENGHDVPLPKIT